MVIPKLGLRNISTAVSIFLVYASFILFGREDDAFFACIAAVVATQVNVEESIKSAKARMIGTMLGGFIGFITMHIILYFNHKIDVILIPIATSILIYLCNLIKRPSSTQIACIVLLSTLIAHKPEGTSVYVYVLTRSLDTFYGVMVAIVVELIVWKLIHIKNQKLNSHKTDENSNT